ncbi:MAG: long-chain fatty acid--CoA ligase [bacterium]|nr:long-chain fatty acid--CoA ligase [bacterium]
MAAQTVPELFDQTTHGYAGECAYRFKRDGRWIDSTWGEQRGQVRTISRALLALGVEHQDRVAILAQTRLEWMQGDLGAALCGGVTVGIYPSSLAADCSYILNHSDSVLIFVEDLDQLEKVRAVRKNLPHLRHVVLIDGSAGDFADVMDWDEFLAAAESVPEETLDARSAAVKPDELASLVYTSGTTGVPKGVMLTHGNILCTITSASDCLAIEGEYLHLLFLPLAHVFARLMAYCALLRPVPTAFAEDLTKLPQNFKEVRPNFFASVPRVYEKVHDKILASAESGSGLKRSLFHWAIGVGTRVSRLKQGGESIPLLLRWQRALADRLVLSKIREAFGGRLRWAISGAAPMNVTVAEFFDACGIPILEGIGMTENSSFSNVNRLDSNRLGTVGPVGPGIEVRIAEDGEVLFRGGNVMAGYFKDPEATRETIDEDGWLHTGDIGELSEDGYLKITDRKKDLIVTAGGKNIAPQRIERVMRTSRYISQVVAYGDKKKFISALVTLDPEAIGEWAVQHGIGTDSGEQLAAHPQTRELIAGEIEQRNRELASFETIKAFHILPRDFSIDDGELTPTLKVRRKAIVEKHRDALEQLYAGTADARRPATAGTD